MVASRAVRSTRRASWPRRASAGQEQDGGRPPAARSCRRGAAARQRRRRAPAQPTQREVLLDEAARQFNARGIAATSVNQVAKRVGLTRAAVYYYVKDSEDLVFQCYLRACQLHRGRPGARARARQRRSRTHRGVRPTRTGARAAAGSGRERDRLPLGREALDRRGRARPQHRCAAKASCVTASAPERFATAMRT